ncbi:hypothetical protein ACQY0O_004694 [Thecaphora frezii]
MATLLLSSFTFANAFDFSPLGYATLTHYDLPSDYVASCGCVGRSTHYPTAALNRAAYGSNTSFGPSCGLCFELRLVSTPLSPPPVADGDDGDTGDRGGGGDGIYFPLNEVEQGKTPNLVVKITDLCPGAGGPWCNATVADDGAMVGNSLGSMVHFDLAWPAKGIPQNFFPGDHDYGVWNVSYQTVSCDLWKGFGDAAALGSDWAQQDSACCPNNPAPSGADTDCPGYYATLGTESALVPNTSNILSQGKGGGASSSAASGSRELAALAHILLGWRRGWPRRASDRIGAGFPELAAVATSRLATSGRSGATVADNDEVPFAISGLIQLAAYGLPSLVAGWVAAVADAGWFF